MKKEESAEAGIFARKHGNREGGTSTNLDRVSIIRDMTGRAPKELIALLDRLDEDSQP